MHEIVVLMTKGWHFSDPNTFVLMGDTWISSNKEVVKKSHIVPSVCCWSVRELYNRARIVIGFHELRDDSAMVFVLKDARISARRTVLDTIRTRRPLLLALYCYLEIEP